MELAEQKHIWIKMSGVSFYLEREKRKKFFLK
jgi:hypothetical protein